MPLTNEELKWATVLAITESPLRIVHNPQGPESGPYLLFYSPDGEFTLEIPDHRKSWNGVIEYSTDANTWAVWGGFWQTLTSVGGRLYLRGKDNSIITYQNDASHRWLINGTNISCIGNIENLLDYRKVNVGIHPTMGVNCFNSLFLNCTNLITPPELPAMTVPNGCYRSMFDGCINLTTAPKLPAVNLGMWCYMGMFHNCERLTVAPSLPAEILTSQCYSNMFSGCSSLTVAPSLPSTTLGNQCYQNMFSGSGLITPPELPARTLANGCYRGMFSSCMNLTTLPNLPATTLTSSCYDTMFYGCKKLRLSTEEVSAYIYPYCIPSDGQGTTASGALTSMFSETVGTFRGTPTINAVYYTIHEPV